MMHTGDKQVGWAPKKELGSEEYVRMHPENE